MTPIISLMSIGVSAYAATNIDDIFVLMVFFFALTLPVR
jgi:cadmium resistance protein CadD (predicted permease)